MDHAAPAALQTRVDTLQAQIDAGKFIALTAEQRRLIGLEQHRLGCEMVALLHARAPQANVRVQRDGMKVDDGLSGTRDEAERQVRIVEMLELLRRFPAA